MAVEEYLSVIKEPLSNILNTNNLVLLVILAFPIMSILNNYFLRSKPLLWWLRSSTEMEEFVKGDDDDGLDFDCVICLSEVSSGEKFRVLPKCKHNFHAGCIDAWLETGQRSCPVCRSPVPAPQRYRNWEEGRGFGDGLDCWVFSALDKFCSRFCGSIRGEIMLALSYQECYFY